MYLWIFDIGCILIQVILEFQRKNLFLWRKEILVMEVFMRVTSIHDVLIWRKCCIDMGFDLM